MRVVRRRTDTRSVGETDMTRILLLHILSRNFLNTLTTLPKNPVLIPLWSSLLLISRLRNSSGQVVFVLGQLHLLFPFSISILPVFGNPSPKPTQKRRRKW
jgi:hypothetical protein